MGAVPDRNADKGRRKEKETEPLPQPSSVSWSVLQKRKDISSEEQMIRKIKSILNKLTPEKYDSLYTQLVELNITTKEQVSELVKELFNKSCTQHHFIEMYTKLCVQFSSYWSEKIKNEDHDNKDMEESEKERRNQFKYNLVSHCENLFDVLKEDRPEEIEKIEDDEERFEQLT